MFSVITNIYNKKSKGPTFMELFTAIGKLESFFFLTTREGDVCTKDVTAHIDTIFKFLPHTRQRRVCGKNVTIISMCAVSPMVHTSNISSCQTKKKLFQFSCGCEKFHEGRSFGFLVINVCNHK